MVFLSFRKKSKKQFNSVPLPELIFDKDTDSNVSSTNNSPVSDSFVKETPIAIFSENSLLDDILNELPSPIKQTYSPTVSSTISSDYYRYSDPPKLDASLNETHCYSDFTSKTQKSLLHKNKLLNEINGKDTKRNSYSMMPQVSTATDKKQRLVSIFDVPQADKSLQSSVPAELSLKSKKLDRESYEKNNVMFSNEITASSPKTLIQLNNMSISRMKERHRQECRRSGQWPQVSNKASVRAQSSFYIVDSQRQKTEQVSPVNVTPGVSGNYRICTPSTSSRTNCHLLPIRSKLVHGDQNRFQTGSLRSTIHQNQKDQKTFLKAYNTVANHNSRIKYNQCIECQPHLHQTRDGNNYQPRYQSVNNRSCCYSQKSKNGDDNDEGDDVALKLPVKTNQKNQNIRNISKLFEDHMSNNPKLKTEIERVPQIYKRKYYSVPNLIHLLDNEKPKLAHKLKVETLIRRKDLNLTVKFTKKNFKMSCNECSDSNCCFNRKRAHQDCRKFFNTRSHTRPCRRTESPSIIHESYFKKGYIESALESSETLNGRTYNERESHPIRIMVKSRCSQDYINQYRHY